MTQRIDASARILLPVMFVLALGFVWSTGSAQSQPQGQQAAAACPGQQMGVQATGVYTPRPVADIMINGKPAPGAIWQPGMRSYWHCHSGGQIMMLYEGIGRVQQRGQKARTLHKGETEYAGPGVEHWHGAAPDSSAHFFQTGIGTGPTLWMEEVGRDDYLGNDIGITSRTEFLRTGVRQKSGQDQQSSPRR